MYKKINYQPTTLEQRLSSPRRGRPSGPMTQPTKDELKSVIKSLMDNNGPSKLSIHQKDIVRSCAL